MQTNPHARLRPDPWRWLRPRVLIEHPDDRRALELAARLRRQRCAVAVCPGPSRRGQCPLTGSDGCAAAEGADLVVSWLGDRPEAREVVDALRTRCSSVPLLQADVDAAPDAVAAAALEALGEVGRDA